MTVSVFLQYADRNERMLIYIICVSRKQRGRESWRE